MTKNDKSLQYVCTIRSHEDYTVIQKRMLDERADLQYVSDYMIGMEDLKKPEDALAVVQSRDFIDFMCLNATHSGMSKDFNHWRFSVYKSDNTYYIIRTLLDNTWKHDCAHCTNAELDGTLHWSCSKHGIALDPQNFRTGNTCNKFDRTSTVLKTKDTDN